MYSYYRYSLHCALHPLNRIPVRLQALWGRDCLTVCTAQWGLCVLLQYKQTTLFQIASKHLGKKFSLIQQILIKPFLMEHVPFCSLISILA